MILFKKPYIIVEAAIIILLPFWIIPLLPYMVYKLFKNNDTFGFLPGNVDKNFKRMQSLGNQRIDD